MKHRRGHLFWPLVVVTSAGNALVVYAIWLLFDTWKLPNGFSVVELMLLGFLVMPWSAKMPSGASWRPGIPLMMMGIFLVQPAFVVLIPIAGVVLVTIRAKSRWWKYFETIAHVALGLAAGAYTYTFVYHLLGDHGINRTIALLPALFVHLVVNRFISVMIIANRENRPILKQVTLTISELHWGYINAYLLIVLASMVSTDTIPYAILVIAILQAGVFLAVSHYSRLEKLQRSIWLDGLTNLENRTAWEQQSVGSIIVQAGMHLYMIDVNNFKDINDKYGHLLGDAVLREIARIIRALLPVDARAFRIGGDEFVVLIPAPYGEDFIDRVREQLSESNNAFVQLDKPITISIGQAIAHIDGKYMHEIFDVADQRMYEEKRNTRYTETGLDFGIPASILSLILAVESKDPYTAGHNLRVAYYALQLATQMGLDEHTRKSIFRSGLVHDVGKIAVPDAILNKQTTLTVSEYEIVKRHPVTGFEMCNKLGFTKEELQVILYHHERFNGSGYPAGLKGDGIPTVACIVAVADVYDALSSARSYRKAWSHNEAMEYLRQHTNTLFDPVCVEEWISLNEAVEQKETFLTWVKGTTFADTFSEVKMVVDI